MMISRDAMIALIRSACQQAGSQRKLAQAWDVSPSYITDLLAGMRDPGPKILDALGYERIVLYRRKSEE